MKHVAITTNSAARWQNIEGRPCESGTAGLIITNHEKQEWKGFGGCFNELSWDALCSLSERDRETILEHLFSPDHCNLNYCRVPIGASDYALTWYSHNETDHDFAMEHFSIARDHKYLIPYIQAARQHRQDLYLFASPWSPPTWMKYPKSYNYGTLVWTPEYLQAYAQYFVKFIQAYAQIDIPINAVHVQNEPNSDQKFPSCLWTGEKMRDFVRDYLGPAFEESGLTTEIWAGTIERPHYNNWAWTILSDPAARAYVKGIGYQWAGQGAVQRTKLAWPDLPIIQTENECGNGENSWEYAHYVFDLIHHYILNGVEAYLYWNMALQNGGLSTWGWTQNTLISVDKEEGRFTYNPEFYLLKHFSAFVKPHSRVLQTSGMWAGNTVAFKNPDGSVIGVIQNPSSEQRQVQVKIADEHVEYTLPPQSFSTIQAS